MEKQTSQPETKVPHQKPEISEYMANKMREEKKYGEKMVRLMSEDIEGAMKVYPALTKINGVSWSLANATCHVLKIDKNRKIGSLTEEEIKMVTEFIKNPKIPEFLFNRNRDFETGKNLHLTGTGLELQTEFDIKRLKKIKSYRGIRHAANLPVRGQRTKSHFRKNKTKSMGIKKRGKTEDKVENKAENFKTTTNKK
ncbi:MAG: 30S ribosomal protein S13, partial [Nanoarchaeota archaeon]